MPNYVLAPALVRLREQVNTAFPGRNKASDGWIGDLAHQSQGSASDHNPWVVLNGQSYVTAIDITHDPAVGFDIDQVSDQLLQVCREGKERRVKYIIANGLIMDTRPQFSPYTWQSSSGHYQHIHISVHSDRRLLDTTDWTIAALNTGADVPLNNEDLRKIRDIVRYEVLATAHDGDSAFLFDNRNIVDIIRQTLANTEQITALRAAFDSLADAYAQNRDINPADLKQAVDDALKQNVISISTTHGARQANGSTNS